MLESRLNPNALNLGTSYQDPVHLKLSALGQTLKQVRDFNPKPKPPTFLKPHACISTPRNTTKSNTLENRQKHSKSRLKPLKPMKLATKLSSQQRSLGNPMWSPPSTSPCTAECAKARAAFFWKSFVFFCGVGGGGRVQGWGSTKVSGVSMCRVIRFVTGSIESWGLYGEVKGCKRLSSVWI